MFPEQNRPKLVEKFFRARASARNTAALERKDPLDANWVYYYSNIYDYQAEFSSIPYADFYRDLLNLRRTHGTVCAVDFLSPGQALFDLRYTGYQHQDFPEHTPIIDLGVSVTLADRRTPAIRKFEELNHLHVVEGDILQGSTWRQIRAKLADQPAHLILCRPVGGYRTIPTTANYALYHTLFTRAYNLLVPGGIMYAALPYHISRKQVEKFAAQRTSLGDQVTHTPLTLRHLLSDKFMRLEKSKAHSLH